MQQDWLEARRAGARLTATSHREVLLSAYALPRPELSTGITRRANESSLRDTAETRRRALAARALLRLLRSLPRSNAPSSLLWQVAVKHESTLLQQIAVKVDCSVCRNGDSHSTFE